MKHPFTKLQKNKSSTVQHEKGKEKKDKCWKRKKKEKENKDFFAGLRMRSWVMLVLIVVVVAVVIGMRIVEGLWVGFWGLVVLVMGSGGGRGRLGI